MCSDMQVHAVLMQYGMCLYRLVYHYMYMYTTCTCMCKLHLYIYTYAFSACFWGKTCSLVGFEAIMCMASVSSKVYTLYHILNFALLSQKL